MNARLRKARVGTHSDADRRWVMSRTTQVSGVMVGLWHADWPGRLPYLRPWS
jgi:hypothetical protein